MGVLKFIEMLPCSCIQVTSDQIKLLEFQKRLEESFGEKYVNLSLYDTLFQVRTMMSLIKIASYLV